MSRSRTTPPKLKLEIDVELLGLGEGDLLDVSLDGFDADFLESGAIPPAPSVPHFVLDVDLPSYDVDESSGVVSWADHGVVSQRATPPVPSGVGGAAMVTMVISAGDLAKLPLDHHAGFILSFVDGMTTVEDILDVSGMPPAEAREILLHLARRGVITIS